MFHMRMSYIEVAFVERILRVFESPLSHSMNHWTESLSGLGEMPFVTPSKCPLLDQASIYKFPQSMGKEAWRHQRHAALDIGETRASGKQFMHYEGHPPFRREFRQL